MKGNLYIFPLLLLLFSCSYFTDNKQEEEKPIARVYEKYLYPEDIKGIVGENISQQDSINILKNYVESWIKQHVVLHFAEKYLDEEKKDVSRQLENYRNSLIIFAYEQELVQQKLDTSITEKEILTYYDANKDNFKLKTNIIKILYVKLERESPQLDGFRKLIRSNKPGDKKKLRNDCLKYAINYSLDDDTWHYFDDILKEVPIKTYDQGHFLRNNKYIETFDSAYTYIMYIKDFNIKESASPLSYVKDDIRQLLINKRKIKLIDKINHNIYQEALKKGDYEIYF